MKLRSYGILATTLLAGCVFTDETNQTGGDFLQNHGAAVREYDSAEIQLPVVSSATIPVEGIMGRNGSEPIVLGAFDADSIRLVAGFDLRSADARDSQLTRQIRSGKDSIVRLRFISYEASDAVSLRMRFYLLKSKTEIASLAAILAGVDADSLRKDFVAISPIADTSGKIGALAHDSVDYVTLPSSVVSALRAELAPDATGSAWLLAVLDSRTGTNAKARYSGVAMVGPDTSVAGASDTVPVLSMGTYEDRTAWYSTGLGKGRKPGVGIWPAGGSRVRVRFDAEQLRQSLSSRFGVPLQAEGGFDNTFNVLQARVGLPFESVRFDGSSSLELAVASTVVTDSGHVSLAGQLDTTDVMGSYSLEITAPSEVLRASGVEKALELKFHHVPGGYWIELYSDDALLALPSRYVLSRGGTTASSSKFFLPNGETVEFRMATQVRVRAWGEPGANGKLHAKWWAIEGAPVKNLQNLTSDSLRHAAQFWNGETSLEQEVRTPLTQLLNRKGSVEWDLVPLVYSTFSGRLSAPVQDPVNVFDRMKVRVRPLVGGSK